MRENISLSLQSILNHKLRSLLTMLGIIIGIASIITIVSTIQGTNEQIKANLIGSGNNVATISLVQDDGYYEAEWSALPEGVQVCDESVRESLLDLQGVSDVSLYRSRDWSENVYFRNTAFNGKLYGVDSHYLPVYGYQLDAGRGFVADDFTKIRKVAIVDNLVAETLFEGEDPINKTLEIKGEPFTVIGVASLSDGTNLSIESVQDYYMYSQDQSGTIFIPTDCWPILFRYDEPQNAAVKATSTDNMTIAGNNVANKLNETLITSQTLKYKSQDLLEQAAQIQELTTSTNQQLIWIAGISLLVGGIGVMNIMLVSVTERTREIGLKKAIGAKRRRILMQFLTEAGVLTCLGGIIGVLCGIGLSFMLSAVMGTPTSISAPACIIAVAFSIVIGVVFGLIPAVKASKLNPIEALRRD